MKKIYIYGIIIFLALITVGYLFLSRGNGAEIRYRTDKVTRGNVVVQVRATGTVNPPLTIEIGSQVSGIISKLFVDYNSVVKKGDLIAVIDSTFLYAAVQQAEANVERNQAELNKAKRDLDRTSDLFKKSLVSQADLDAATATYESDVAQLKQSKAALNQARVNLHYAIIRSPSDGVIIERAVEVGQTVAASLQAPKLFSLATDLHHMQVEASVDEADIGQIQDGQSVTFTVDAYPELTFNGVVTQVRLNPVITQNVVTYTVIIGVNNPDLKLRPGMTATASILVDRRENVLRVPTLAIRFQPPQEVADKFRETSSGGQFQRQGGGMGGQRSGGFSQQQGSSGDRSGWRQRQGGGGTDHQGGGDNNSGGPVRVSRVWVLDAQKNLRPVRVRLGLNDNRYIEVDSDQLKEGDEIVIGMMAGEAASNNGQTNPFQPRMMGGGPRGR